MARPRYQRDEQTAREKIVEAFWRMVEDGPYDKVSVRGLVRESGVNGILIGETLMRASDKCLALKTLRGSL